MKSKLLSLLLIAIELTSPLQAFAQTTGATTTAPSRQTTNTLPLSSSPLVSSAPNPSLPVLDTQTQSQTSAFISTSPVVQKLAKRFYRSDEDVSVSIANPQNDSFHVAVFDGKGVKADVAPQQINPMGMVTFAVSPRTQFRPGKYKLVVTDASSGKTSQQDFSWGVLAINPDRSVYLPSQTADLAMAVLDDQSNMVCNAILDLKITNATTNTADDLSTNNGKISANAQCQSHQFSLQQELRSRNFRLSQQPKYLSRNQKMILE